MGAGMMNLPKAPADITPEKFFKEWLPGQLSSFKDMISSLGGDVAASIATRVTGDGGGEWTAVLDGGEVKVEDGLRGDAVVTFIVETGSFKDAVTGQLEDLMKPPPGAGDMSPEQAAAKAKENMEAIKGIDGTIKFNITDDSKPFSAMIKFGGDIKDDPDATVTMDRDTAIAIANGDTNPQAAFMGGQVQIEGDLSILMQLTPILMP